MQGLTELQLSPQLLRQLLADIADNAAFGSMVMGELPGLPLQMAEVLSSFSPRPHTCTCTCPPPFTPFNPSAAASQGFIRQSQEAIIDQACSIVVVHLRTVPCCLPEIVAECPSLIC